MKPALKVRTTEFSSVIEFEDYFKNTRISNIVFFVCVYFGSIKIVYGGSWIKNDLKKIQGECKIPIFARNFKRATW